MHKMPIEANIFIWTSLSKYRTTDFEQVCKIVRQHYIIIQKKKQGFMYSATGRKNPYYFITKWRTYR